MIINTSAVSTTVWWIAETQLCKLRGTSDTFVRSIIVCFLWTKPTTRWYQYSFSQKIVRACTLFYPVMKDIIGQWLLWRFAGYQLDTLPWMLPGVKALVRWATGKRLTNRLPKLSLITPPPLRTVGFLVFVWGRTCPLRSYLQSLGTQGEWFIRILTWGKSLFFKQRFHGGREIRNPTNDAWSVDDAICEGISPLGYSYWKKVNQSPTRTKRYNALPRFEQRDSWSSYGAVGSTITQGQQDDFP